MLLFTSVKKLGIHNRNQKFHLPQSLGKRSEADAETKTIKFKVTT